MKTKLIIKKGKSLTLDELATINSWRKKEFNSKSVVKPRSGGDDWNKAYFILKDNNGHILAFGRIHDVNIEFLGKVYSVFGIATLIVTVKGKGCGSRLLKAQLAYTKEHGKPAIGFCNKKLTDFYRKRDLLILKNGVKRFLYKDDDNFLHKDPWGGGDVIYSEGKDGLMQKLIAYPNEKVITYRQHW